MFTFPTWTKLPEATSGIVGTTGTTGVTGVTGVGGVTGVDGTTGAGVGLICLQTEG